MTTTNSPEAVADPAGDSSASTPYGTRSRGRNAPRPNYAEDRDIDLDLELAAPTSKSAKRNSGVALNNIVNGSKSEGEKASSAQPRKSLTNGTSSNPSTKEAIPGTSSFSARPEDINGISSLRKRKHAASTSYPTAVAGGNAAKKIFTSAPGDGDECYITNMVSFETNGHFLKDGKLRTDDGITLAVNGWSSLYP